ncbi:hypothetical protein [Kitasatospora cheerisanensis]|uniref:Uncharacterized protein n=1 Tax=Kitasatospora cheerisanensis KCTC 2395 TaxID=1348663 RepID=A0A066ZAR5_9ACTN|nr:hypothetical protein [Kitasatospora cheerisanensis]KDN87406.1 hypothetical protein KCH_07780 [Kitasatospora cheerisanensis KCTC 2395]
MSTKHRSTGERPPFVLWREVLVAYAMPAVMAAAGGVATGRPQLVIAALTTIAGTSAVVAALVGAGLRHRPDDSWTARMPRPLLAVGSGLGAAVLASLLGRAGAHWLPDVPALADSPWPGRLRLDLPISAAIAATMITWRWRGTRRKA